MPGSKRIDEKIAATLIAAAEQARTRAYAPYSGYTVGSAVLSDIKEIHTGCNIENVSYPVGLCAERAAIASAIGGGCKRVYAVAIVGGKAGEPAEMCTPCGMCRQFMLEFGNPKTLLVLVAKSKTKYEVYLLEELLPMSFAPKLPKTL